MAVAVLTEFPSSFIAGDTIRVTIGDSRFPSSGWTLKVLLSSGLERKSFTTSVGTGDSFDLVISSTDSAAIKPGLYSISYIFTETASEDRQTVTPCGCSVVVYGNPAAGASKSMARQILEAMESAYLRLVKSPRLSVNFNGQSFTNRNLKDFAEAIDRQRAIVLAEESQFSPGCGSGGRVLHPL